MKFNFSEVEVKEGFLSIEPGIREVTITSIEEGILPFGDNIPCVSFNFKEDATGGTLRQDFSFEVQEDKEAGKSAHQQSPVRIKAIGTKIIPDEVFNNIKSTAELAAALVGKEVRLKFEGREYLDKEGKVRVRTQLPYFRFAEVINIPREKSTLRFDVNNQWDMKRLNPTTSPVEGFGTAAKSDDLPF